MVEIVSVLNSEMEHRKLMLASLTEKCRALFQPRRSNLQNEVVVYEDHAPQSLQIKEVDAEEKGQLEMAEKALRKAALTRGCFEKELKHEASSHSKEQKIFNKIQAPNELSKKKQRTLNKESVISLSQLDNLKSLNKTNKSPRMNDVASKKKSAYKPAHVTAPYRTFAQFKFPTQAGRRCKSASKEKLPAFDGVSEKFKNEVNVDCAVAESVNNSTPSSVLTKDLREAEADVIVDEQNVVDEQSANFKCAASPQQYTLKDIGKYLQMPPTYLVLKAQNQKLRNKLSKLYSNRTLGSASSQLRFLASLENQLRTNLNKEMGCLYETYRSLDRCKEMLRLQTLLDQSRISDEGTSLELHQWRLFINNTIQEFEAHSKTCRELIQRGGMPWQDANQQDQTSCGFVGKINILPESGSVIVYQNLQQLDEYQRHYEHLVQLRLQKFILGTIPRFMERLKTEQPTERNFHQTFRCIHSLLHSNGRLFPALVEN